MMIQWDLYSWRISVIQPASAAMKRTTPTSQTTQVVIKPQKIKATPMASPAGKYVGWGKGVSGSICQPGGTASECCVVVRQAFDFSVCGAGHECQRASWIRIAVT